MQNIACCSKNQETHPPYQLNDQISQKTSVSMDKFIVLLLSIIRLITTYPAKLTEPLVDIYHPLATWSYSIYCNTRDSSCAFSSRTFTLTLKLQSSPACSWDSTKITLQTFHKDAKCCLLQ